MAGANDIQLARACCGEGNFTRAAAICEAVLASSPNHAEALTLLGISQLSLGRADQGIAHLQSAVDAEPENKVLWLNLGAGLCKAGQAREATRCLLQAIQRFGESDQLLYNLASAQQATGEIDSAIGSYRRCIELNRSIAEAHNNVATLLVQRGQIEEAIDSLREALRLKPDYVRALTNLGSALTRSGTPLEALAPLKKALELAPKHAPALMNLAEALTAQGRPDEAIAVLRGAVAGARDFIPAYLGLGRLLLDRNEPAAAVEVLRVATSRPPGAEEAYDLLAQALVRCNDLPSAADLLERSPGCPTAHTAAGYLKLNQRQLHAAREHFDAALNNRPNDPAALKGRGIVFAEAQQHPKAIACYRAALTHAPNDHELYHDLGFSLGADGQPTEALEAYDRALSLEPKLVHSWNNRGNVLRGLGRIEEAARSYEQAVQLDGASADGWHNIATLLSLGRRFAEALEAYDKVTRLNPDYPYLTGNTLAVAMSVCDWGHYSERVEKILAGVDQGKRITAPGTLILVCEDSEPLLKAARVWIADRFPQARAPLCRVPLPQASVHVSPRDRRIRLGYMSADFREHPVASSIVKVLESHDRERFEIIGVSLALDPTASEMRLRLERACHRFVDVSKCSDFEAAKTIRSLEVDILIDLMGHTDGGRTGVLAFRPAPVQVNFLGYPATSGAGYLDYIVADRVVVPDGSEYGYSEKIVRLPGCCLPNGLAHLERATVPTRADAGLPEHAVVFCVFNNPSKITPAVFDVWMRLLLKVPGSVLWLTPRGAGSAANLVKNAESRGVEGERLVFAGRVPRIEDHLARLTLADIFLDTLPYNAHTTGSDALWAGVPVVTCLGKAFAGRVGASMLTTIGMPELIANSLEEYEALALRLATDSGLRGATKTKLRRNAGAHDLFDTVKFTRSLENAYERMWQRLERDLPPDHISDGRSGETG